MSTPDPIITFGNQRGWSLLDSLSQFEPNVSKGVCSFWDQPKDHRGRPLIDLKSRIIDPNVSRYFFIERGLAMDIYNSDNQTEDEIEPPSKKARYDPPSDNTL